MKSLKIISAVLLSATALLSPFAFLFGVLFLAPPQYENTFLGVLDDKYERLNSIKEDKIVIVGGSSVAFGVDSELIENYTGMPVVNFGLYAALGTKLMLDLSRSGISDGDIVIIAPETDKQTFSLYFNSSSTLRSLDSDYSMLKNIKRENMFPLLGASWNFAVEKLSYAFSGKSPTPTGIYSASSFNSYGDIEYTREENIMPLYYDPNTKITLDESLLSDEFIDYLNEYIAFCKGRGASVYFSWCPMNSLGVVNPEGAKAFEKLLKSKLDCELISDINSYILPPEYFYDTNFHMNDAGMLRHSVNLTEDILLTLGKPTLVEMPEGADPDKFEGLVAVPKPQLPFFDSRYFETDENAKYFTYTQTENGTYTITGLSELGLMEESLTVPMGAETYKVTAIARDAFRGGALKELIIPEGTNLKIFENDAFRGAGTLLRLVIHHKNAEDILPPASFAGVSDGFKVYIPAESDYTFDYYWSERGLTFERIEN